MNLEQINRLLTEAMQLTHHRDFVIIGSLSVLGSMRTLPERMTMSTDVDLYPKNDPGRAGEIASKFGLGSEFEQCHGYYAEAVSPALPTLPEGWQARLVRVMWEPGEIERAKCLLEEDRGWLTQQQAATERSTPDAPDVAERYAGAKGPNGSS